MNAPALPHLWSAFAGGAGVFIAGAWLGRLLGALIERSSREAGHPSPHYGAPRLRSGPIAAIPVLGRIAARSGRTSWRALGLELAAGAAALACWELFPPAKAACGTVLLLGLIGATAVDLEHTIIPELFTVGLALAGLAVSAAAPSLHACGSPTVFHCLRSLSAGLLGLAVGSSLALWIALIGELLLDREVLGFGDVKFLGAIGAFCGWQGAVFSIFGGAAVSAAVILAAEAHRRISGASSAPLFRGDVAGGRAGRLGWGAEFPFGPMLAAAAAAYFLALHPWINPYLAQFRVLF